VSALEVSRILVKHGWLPESAESQLPASVEEMLDDLIVYHTNEAYSKWVLGPEENK
jgi:hypothetical protein